MILHKFLNTPQEIWNNGFTTKDAILQTPYFPKVLFIGTFNHGWIWNTADFFYGRDM